MMYDVPMTLGEVLATLFILGFSALIMAAIAIESSCGMPARVCLGF